MKKFFVMAAACLSLSTLGVTMTSCDDELVSEIISELITNITGQQGEVYSYSVEGMAQRMSNNGSGYAYGAAAVKFKGTIPVTVTNSSTATITIPGMTVDNIQIGDVSFVGMQLIANESAGYTQMTMSDEGVGVQSNGAIVDGNEIAVTNVYVEDARLTSEEVYIKKFQIFFGENGEYVLELTNITGAISQ